ncbi:hypothetical protein B0H16DRAFT_1714047 [Mycena metata]|uniref:Uncharacterized protein n=1 Tax=Mycena metata TaxID=1033252 RepID=A0AAD7JYP7_9AGAR|nr:hypothetical protein B0H16DRAFT_1714047 [Mycena metata]
MSSSASYADLRLSPSLLSNGASSVNCEYQPGGCFRQDSRSRIVPRTMQFLHITIVSFFDTKIVFQAYIRPRNLTFSTERDEPTITIFPPTSFASAMQSTKTMGISDTIPVPGEMPWSLEAVKSARGAIYCSTYSCGDGVYRVAEMWGNRSFLVARDTLSTRPRLGVGLPRSFISGS